MSETLKLIPIYRNNYLPPAPTFYVSGLGIMVKIEAEIEGYRTFNTEHGELYLFDQVAPLLSNRPRDLESSLKRSKEYKSCLINPEIRGYYVNGRKARIIKHCKLPYIALSDLCEALGIKALPEIPNVKNVFYCANGNEVILPVILFDDAYYYIRELTSNPDRFKVIEDLIKIEETIKETDGFLPLQNYVTRMVCDEEVRFALYDGKLLVHGNDIARLMGYKKESEFARRKFQNVTKLKMEVINKNGHIKTTISNFIDINDLEDFLLTLRTPKAMSIYEGILDIKK